MLGRDFLWNDGAQLSQNFRPWAKIGEGLDTVQGFDASVLLNVQGIGEQLPWRFAGLFRDVLLPVVVAELLDLGDAVQGGRVEEDLVPVTQVLSPQRHPVDQIKTLV